MNYINKAKIFITLNNKNTNTAKRYIEKLELLEKYLIPEYQKIQTYFDKYTKHDWVHTIKVLDYIYDLIDNPEMLEEYEIMLIIYSALLHDIGMAFTENEIEDLISNTSDYDKEKITSIIRTKHGEFAEYKIKQISEITDPQSLKDLFKVCLGDTDTETWDLRNNVATICHSHTESINWIKTKFSKDPLGMYVACLLRLADLLDIDGNRASDFYRATYKIEDTSGNYYAFNQIVGDSKKIKTCKDVGCVLKCNEHNTNQCCSNPYKQIELIITFPINLEHATEVAVRNMISDYIEDLETEISDVRNCLKQLNYKYNIKLFPKVLCNDTPIHVESTNNMRIQKLSINYSAIKTLLSNEQLYPNKLYGIREIIQNAYDACKAFSELKHNDYGWDPKITITLDTDNKKLIISDNGVGMSEYVIKEYFLNIGKSIYNFDPAYLYDNYHQDHIGHFGLGFFSAFMLSTKIEVVTTSYSDNKTIRIELNKYNNYATLIDGEGFTHGTNVILDFNEIKKNLCFECEKDCMDLILYFIQESFAFDGIKICYKDNTSVKDIILKNILNYEGESISSSLIKIEAKANISNKILPPIFYAESPDSLSLISYDELLKKFAETHKTNSKIPYINGGSFLIFTGNEKIEKDFMEKSTSLNRRRNYSPFSTLSDSINISSYKFFEENKLEKSLHGDYQLLNLIVNGNNSILYEENIICSKTRTIMKKYDACGIPQFDDFIYLRDVYLPNVHVCLPALNFRYEFNGLMANIKTDDIFPTITRETLTIEHTTDISYAIGYAILQHKIQEEVNSIENELLCKYFYKKLNENIFIKKEELQ